MHGHRARLIGVPPFTCRGTGGASRVTPAPTALSVPRDRQIEAVAELVHERWRRELHLCDERTPLAVIEGLAA